MKRYGKYGRVYSIDEIHHRIDAVARKKLGITGEQAIQIINNDEWECQDKIDVWLWLKGFVGLLSNEVPERREEDACI